LSAGLATKGRRRIPKPRFGEIFVESIRPEKTAPIPLRAEPRQVGTTILRFLGLLLLAVVALVLVDMR